MREDELKNRALIHDDCNTGSPRCREAALYSRPYSPCSQAPRLKLQPEYKTVTCLWPMCLGFPPHGVKIQQGGVPGISEVFLCITTEIQLWGLFYALKISRWPGQYSTMAIFLEILLLTINFVSIRLMMGQLFTSSQSLLHVGNGKHAECAK